MINNYLDNDDWRYWWVVAVATLLSFVGFVLACVCGCKRHENKSVRTSIPYDTKLSIINDNRRRSFASKFVRSHVKWKTNTGQDCMRFLRSLVYYGKSQLHVFC